MQGHDRPSEIALQAHWQDFQKRQGAASNFTAYVMLAGAASWPPCWRKAAADLPWSFDGWCAGFFVGIAGVLVPPQALAQTPTREKVAAGGAILLST